MTKILAISKANWADEMDILGVSVMDLDELIKWQEAAQLVHDEINPSDISVYVGTNQEILFDNLVDAIECEYVEISDEQANILERLVRRSNFIPDKIIDKLYDICDREDREDLIQKLDEMKL